jgi:hypothetical protein
MTVGEAVHAVLATLLRRLLRSTDPIDQERFRRHVQPTIAKLIRRATGMVQVLENRHSEQ